jgi:prepilin-type processing-associated H-X9-DG protein
LNGPKGPPDKIFVFLDMREDHLNWGSFLTDMSGYSGTAPYPAGYGLQDLPGYYHERGCSFAMADGHVEMKRWLDARTVPVLGTSSPGSGWSCPGNPDVAWLQDHSTRPR